MNEIERLGSFRFQECRCDDRYLSEPVAAMKSNILTKRVESL